MLGHASQQFDVTSDILCRPDWPIAGEAEKPESKQGIHSDVVQGIGGGGHGKETVNKNQNGCS